MFSCYQWQLVSRFDIINIILNNKGRVDKNLDGDFVFFNFVDFLHIFFLLLIIVQI